MSFFKEHILGIDLNSKSELEDERTVIEIEKKIALESEKNIV